MDRSSAADSAATKQALWPGNGASRHRFLQGHLITARVLLGATFVQILLVSFGISFDFHRAFGIVIGLLSLLVATLALMGRVSRSTLGLSSLIPLLVLLQLVLIGFRTRLPVLAGLHGINAFVILGVALAVAIESEEETKVPVG